jgi:hypothetical protein
MVNKRIKDRDDQVVKALMKKGKAVQKSIKTLTELITPKRVQGIQRDPNLVSSKLRTVSQYVTSSWGAPGQMSKLAMAQAEAGLDEALGKINQFFDSEWPAYQQEAEAADISFFEKYETLTVK